jgi:hypothetical protein
MEKVKNIMSEQKKYDGAYEYDGADETDESVWILKSGEDFDMFPATNEGLQLALREYEKVENYPKVKLFRAHIAKPFKFKPLEESK